MVKPKRKRTQILAASSCATGTRQADLAALLPSEIAKQACGPQELGKLEQDRIFPPGVYTIEDMKAYSAEQKICPYFAVRRMMSQASVIIYSFHYLLDPKVAEQVSREISKDAIVVFDEAHNIGKSLSLLQLHSSAYSD